MIVGGGIFTMEDFQILLLRLCWERIWKHTELYKCHVQDHTNQKQSIRIVVALLQVTLFTFICHNIYKSIIRKLIYHLLRDTH